MNRLERSDLETIIFVVHGISLDNLRLQPWKYVFEIAKRIAASDHFNVTIITNGSEELEEEIWDDGLRVLKTRFLSVKHKKKLKKYILGHKPRQVWWSVTPRSVVYLTLFRALDLPLVGLITCPLYSFRELIRASASGVPFDELSALWRQRLIPRRLFGFMLSSRSFVRVFVQSEANKVLVSKCGVPRAKLTWLPVGIDPSDLQIVEGPSGELAPAKEGGADFLYFGSPKRIRGFYSLLTAFKSAVQMGCHSKLVILARGASEEDVNVLRSLVRSYGIEDQIVVEGGWLTRQEVWSRIDSCGVAVLPFIIVPSDVPIAILEAMAKGKPVIGGNVDGIPELIRGRGLVVDPLNVQEFAQAMVKLACNAKLRERLGEEARSYMLSYPKWDEVGRKAMQEARLI